MSEAIIKLAEAMGINPNQCFGGCTFDPFFDANCDYAVLEWMRDQPPQKHPLGYLYDKYIDQMDGCPVHEYEIGDYARAACKELGIDCE